MEPQTQTPQLPPVLWPHDHARESLRRANILYKIRQNPSLFTRARDHYRYDPIQWIEDWCVTMDPRAVFPQARVMPFILFPKQKEFILFLLSCMDDKQNGLVEKARDIGASWLCCAFSVWLWLYHPGSIIGWGSRKAEYVDKSGDMKAIFPKMVQIIDNLPRFMWPKGFDIKAHVTHMKIINPENESSIIGEAGDNIGRGGRSTIFFKDESAHYENPESIEAALGDNTDVQIDISSVNGTANVFYRRRMKGEIWTPGCVIARGIVRVFIFDWRDHPGKTQAWYDERRDRAEREGLGHIFAQEVDRDYSGSVQGVIIPQEWVKACLDAHIKLGFEPTGIMRGMQDVADGGGDKNALVGGRGRVCQFASAWGGEAGAAARHSIPICIEWGVTDLYYDCIGVGVGFKTEVNTMMKEPSWPSSLKVHPWDAGAAPLRPDSPCIPGDPKSPKNGDMYKNMKAQAWFVARSACYKTWRAVVHGDKYPFDELVSIDSTIRGVHQLCMELSQAVRKDNREGKTVVDKKPDGAVSPNLGDAFIGWLHPCKKVSAFGG